MEYIGKEKFGTFKTNGVIRAIPTRPWITDSYPGDLSGRGKGDIRAYASGDTCHIGNSDTDETYNLTWIHLKDGNKHLYISDRVIFTNVSWDYLNKLGRIYGTPVTIDGKDYKLRVLAENEWIGIIRNVYNISGLPMPTQEDLTDTNTYGQLDGQHNQLWNWWGIWTTCQETISGSVMERGYSSVNKVTYYSASASFKDAGWRPVLEYIEIDPPGKPIPVYPTSEDRTHPEPIQGEITLQTKYNGEGSLELMDVFVYNYTQQEFEYKSGEVANTTGVMQLPVTFEAGSNYKITVRHKGTGGFAKGWLELYVIGGRLGKYKISEPITVKQFDPIKSYTGGDNLIMKPQQFPETETSVIRLVPQTMNTLTVRGIEGNELEYSESTKTPVIGDRLLVDDKVVTVTEAQGMQDQEEEIVRNIGGISSGSISLGITTSGKYVKRGDYIYTIKREDTTSSELRVVKISLADNTVENTYRRIVTGNTDFAIAEGDTGIFVAYNHTDTKKVNIYWKGYESGTAIKETSFALNITGLNCVYDSKAKLLHLIVNLDNPGANKKIISAVTYNASDPTNMTSIGQKNLLETDASTTICEPATIYTPDIFGVTVGIISNNQYANKLHLYGYDNGTWSSSIGTLNTKPNYKPFGIHLEYIPKDKDSARVARILATTSARDTINNLGDITVSIGIGGYNMKHSVLGVPDPTENYGCLYSEDEGFILLYSRGKTLFMRQKKNVEDEWGRANSIIESLALNQRAIIPVNISPKAYCSFPSMAYINNEVPGEAASMKYKTTRLTGRIEKKVFLDKEVSVQAGKKIKYLDYDLEVKAGEETATVTPTNITNDYYEYEASFNKKESERDITIKGRNTKLTTLYYYNY